MAKSNAHWIIATLELWHMGNWQSYKSVETLRILSRGCCWLTRCRVAGDGFGGPMPNSSWMRDNGQGCLRCNESTAYLIILRGLILISYQRKNFYFCWLMKLSRSRCDCGPSSVQLASCPGLHDRRFAFAPDQSEMLSSVQDNIESCYIFSL